MWEQSTQFWAVRDAWRTATRAASQNRRAQFSLAKQETRWAVNADRYLRNSPSAAAFVKFNQEQIRASLRHHLESIGPELAAQFDEVLAPIAAIAFGAWPVRSGYSKSTIELYYVQPAEGEFTGGIAVGAEYALKIKGGPTRKLIGGPVAEARRRIGEGLLVRMARNV